MTDTRFESDRAESYSTNRYEAYACHPPERPKHMFQYYVSGRGAFPWDMLRFDQCWPATTDDAMKMERRHGDRELRSIRMRSYKAPTIERWTSFLWSVGLEKL